MSGQDTNRTGIKFWPFWARRTHLLPSET